MSTIAQTIAALLAKMKTIWNEKNINPSLKIRLIGSLVVSVPCVRQKNLDIGSEKLVANAGY